MVFALLNGNILPQAMPFFSDVRDIAKAHVTALEAVRAGTIKQNEPQRFLTNGGSFHWKDVAEYLAEDRDIPEEIKKKLPSKEARDSAAPFPGPPSTIDTTHAREILGITESIDWKTSMKETALSLVEEAKGWKA
jgi:nucleoside-diphosphate-sugar epimerase